MSAATAARADVGTARTRLASPFTFAVASEVDDPEIRRLLREHPLPGSITLSFEREPNALLAGSIEGDVHQTLVARCRTTGEIAGLAARSVYTAFVNGRATRLGYLGQLRMANGHRYLRALIDGGFAFCRSLHDEGDAPAYFTSLIVDNHAARRLLIDRQSHAAPRFVPIDHLETCAISTRRSPPLLHGKGVHVRQGSAAVVDEIAACLQRNLGRYQFAPHWDAADLQSSPRTRGLSPGDFVVAVSGRHIVGCAALWDQRAFKQVIVRGYRPSLRRARPFINLAAHLLGRPHLPAIGRSLELAYLSHVAVDEDHPGVLAALVAAQLRRGRDLGVDYLVAGFPDRHPFQAVVRRRWAHRAYRSVIYAAYWPAGEAFVRSLDGRPAQPEVAIL